MHSRFLICLLGSLIAGLALWGCENNQPIKIGFVAGTSGRVADLGISGRDAVQLLVDQCNEAGGIEGRRVQLITRDDKQDPDTARQVVRELIEQEAAAIIGPMTSDMATAVTPLLNEAKVLAVSPTATTQKLSGIDDYFIRVSATTKDYASKSANYQIKSGNAKRITAAYDLGNRSFTENWLKNFKMAFTSQGGEIIASHGFRTGDGNTFLVLARKLLADEPDCVLIVANSMDCALLCQQLRKIDGKIRITLADWGATERLLALGGKAVEGVTVVQTFDRASKNPHYLKFREAYLKRYQREPGFPGVYAHDAAQVVLEALRVQKSGQSLKQTILSQATYDGLQGSFSFNQYGDVTRSNASISIVKNRQFVVVE
jgi:branched-chain amino acid transport system substrate-binding protein